MNTIITVITVDTCHRNTTAAEDAEFLRSIASSLRRVANKAVQTARFYTTCHGDSYWKDQQARAAEGAAHAELAEWINISSVSPSVATATATAAATATQTVADATESK